MQHSPDEKLKAEREEIARPRSSPRVITLLIAVFSVSSTPKNKKGDFFFGLPREHKAATCEHRALSPPQTGVSHLCSPRAAEGSCRGCAPRSSPGSNPRELRWIRSESAVTPSGSRRAESGFYFGCQLFVGQQRGKVCVTPSSSPGYAQISPLSAAFQAESLHFVAQLKSLLLQQGQTFASRKF